MKLITFLINEFKQVREEMFVCDRLENLKFHLVLSK